MKYITIKITPDSLGRLIPYPRDINLGASGDKSVRGFLFDRSEEYKDYDLVLRFYADNNCIQRKNLGKGNEYPIDSGITRFPRLRMNIKYQLGSNYREDAGDVNLRFKMNGGCHERPEPPPCPPHFDYELLEELEHSAHVGELFYEDNILSVKNTLGDVIASVVIEPNDTGIKIDDDETSLETTWSSQKIQDTIDDMIIGAAGIDDDTISEATTWSSAKIQEEVASTATELWGAF